MNRTTNRGDSWYRLDNTAKMYPIAMSDKSSHVFRFSVMLTHNIDPILLQKAVSSCRARFPTFYVKLRRGLFWFYYEPNEKEPVVLPESPYACQPVDRQIGNGFFFTFYYYKSRISLELFHGISDGMGAQHFLKAVLLRYLGLCGFPQDGEGLVLNPEDSPTPAETEDSYVKHYIRGKRGREILPTAYRITGERFSQDGFGMINGAMETSELIDTAKSHGATVTQYLTAVLTYAISDTGSRRKLLKRPVNINVPVDIRRFYKSSTLRNFFIIFRTSFQRGKEVPAFSDIIAKMKQDFIDGLEPDRVQNEVNSNVFYEKNAFIRSAPLPLKWAFMKGGYTLTGIRPTTAILTNLGTLELPESMKPHISGFELYFDTERAISHNVSIVSYGGKTNIGFTRNIVPNDIERAFFSFLAKDGIKLAVKSNFWEDYSDN